MFRLGTIGACPGGRAFLSSRLFRSSFRVSSSKKVLPPSTSQLIWKTLVAFKSTMPLESSSSDPTPTPMDELRSQYEKEISALPEHNARLELQRFLEASSSAGSHRDASDSIFHHAAPSPPLAGYQNLMTPDQIRSTLDAAMATFHLHVESRIASLVGQGFYTIGPCGEEMLSSIAHALRPTEDAVALHYRHLGVSILRQLCTGRSLEDILLDRARGYTVSKFDPVTGGVHCAIGSRFDAIDDPASSTSRGGGDYVVTSTLASQCPPAVGRALGFSLADKILPSSSLTIDSQDGTRKKKQTSRTKKPRPISFVTVGDGSIHNHHFLSAYNLARHARHRHIKCPVVFGISDNGISISYKTDGYTNLLFPPGQTEKNGIPIFHANGRDMLDVYDKTLNATQYARTNSAPVVIIYKEIIRRFGHAATDRQHAYLTAEDIKSMAESDVLASAMIQAVEEMSVGTYSEMKDRFNEIGCMAREAFNVAAEEEKVTREDMLEAVCQPLVQVPRLPAEELCVDVVVSDNDDDDDNVVSSSAGRRSAGGKKEVMRKHMTRVISEILTDNPDVVYIGEDVEHGGYYLVTDGLVNEFPNRVIDFPPDETTLLGTGMGYAQVGMTPIVEIPYAKYLDCGVDMFYELSIMNWLTGGQKPNGMIVRLQGFDRGTFGGNFHTHNMLSHMPPGVDVVCYSNGEDYVRGFRNAIKQAKAGRVVVLVDCTNLLNLRHLYGKDRGWERPYPPNDDGEIMGFHDVRRYGTKGQFAIITYGNGVVTSLQARRAMVESNRITSENELDIIDCPYISSVPEGLLEIVGNYEGVIFADICKEGPGSNPLSAMIPTLQREKMLPSKWEFAGAPRTYNPLGSLVTFLNMEDIENAFIRLEKRQ